MTAYLLDCLNLLGRWVHLITGIAWIGASFYFVWLDNHLLAPRHAADRERGIGGELWAVHGGGFYHAEKFKLAPAELPEPLHWFKWEAYTTWLSGIFLMALIYWFQAEIYLIDPAVLALPKWLAVVLGMGTLAGGWLAYDRLCKSPLGADDKKLGLVIFAFTAVAAFVLCHLFSGRGAFIHFGAMLGTIMVANVFFVIIPGQRELVQATREGRVPAAAYGIKAKQRSVHNTYFTLPVLFTMISNHYAGAYGHEFNWLILIAISAAGALVRVWFVQRHFGKAGPMPLVAAGVIALCVFLIMSPRPRPVGSELASEQNAFTQIKRIVDTRCLSCHASAPTQPGFSAPPKGVVFDSAHDIASQAVQIHQQTVLTRAMPIGNLTGMTDDERALLDAWVQAGAKVQ